MHNKKSLHDDDEGNVVDDDDLSLLLVLYTLSKIHLMKIRKFSLHSDESLLINIVDISSSRKSRGLKLMILLKMGMCEVVMIRMKNIAQLSLMLILLPLLLFS